MMDAKQLSDKALVFITQTMESMLKDRAFDAADSQDQHPTECGPTSFCFNSTQDIGGGSGRHITHQRIVYKVTVEASFQDDDA